MTDRFKNVTNPSGHSNEFHQMVSEIESEFRRKYPRTYQSVIDLLERYLNQKLTGYDLLYGLVQEGKSLAINIAIWLLTFKHFNRPVYLTKNLGSIRSDIIMKFEQSGLIEIISNVCQNHQCSVEDTKYFSIKPYEYQNQKSIKSTWGYVPILILNSTNYKALSAFHRQVYHEPNAKIVYLIDEVHLMYADFKSFIQNRGLRRNKLSSRHIMHWLFNKAKQQKCTIIGVTATPYRAMTCDPICRPRSVTELLTDPPFKDAVYYGYNRKQEHIVNINVDVYEPDQIIQSIEKCLSRPRGQINGCIEVPLICLTTERDNLEQNKLNTIIMEHFGNRVHSQTFHQDNNQYPHNAKTLKDYFQSYHLTFQVCQNGGFILIGKARLDTGVTIKPEINDVCQQTYAGIKYQIFGITDQFVETTDSSSIQSLMQLMRLFGWYPRGHQSNLWVSSLDHVSLFKTGLIRVDNQFFNQYDGSIGARSIKKVIIGSKVCKHVCGGDNDEDPYKTEHQFKTESIIIANLPIDRHHLIELKTRIHKPTIDSKIIEKIAKDLTISNPKLKDLKVNPNLYKLLRKEYEKLDITKTTLTNDDINKAHIFCAYDDVRKNHIFEACVRPHKDRSNWQINGIVWGNHGIETELKDIWLIMFEQKHAERKTYWDSSNAEKTFYFDCGNGYITINQSKTFEHKYLATFDDFVNRPPSPTSDHSLACGDDIDKLADAFKSGITPLNTWHLFITICSQVWKQSGSSKLCSPSYKLIQSNYSVFTTFKNITKMTISRDEMIKRGSQLLKPILGIP